MSIFVDMRRLELLHMMITLVLMTACADQDSKNTAVTDQMGNMVAQESTAYQSLDLVALSAEAQEEVAIWLEYITAKAEVNRLKEAEAPQIAGNISTLLQIAKELERTIPDNFQRKPIESRVLVFVTKVNVLEAAVEQRNPDAAKIRALSTEVVIAFDHLTIQLNETFLEGIDAFEMELDEDKENSLLEEMPTELQPIRPKKSGAKRLDTIIVLPKESRAQPPAVKERIELKKNRSN